jgi:DNA-binding beta-propeller fold protein YncE
MIPINKPIGLAALLCIAICSPAVSAQRVKQISLTPIGRYSAGPGIESAEIAAYDPATKRIFSINPALSQVDVLDIADPTNPTLAFTFAVNGRPNSVAFHEGVLAVAVENSPKTDPGFVQLFDTEGTLLNTVTVGALPDMLTFTPNGRRLLVANEGEPSDDYSIDPEGSVSIINLKAGAGNLTQDDVRTATFNDAIAKLNASSIRQYGPDATLAQDLEPEYITISRDSKTAWITLQENNAIAVLDVEAGVFTQLVGLGFKDHSLPDNGLDASDRDGGINIANWPAFGIYQPDAIDSYRLGKETYLVMVNEGDTRAFAGFNEEARVSALTLDPTVFPNAEILKEDANLGRLTVTNATGDTDGDGDFDQILVPGGRSFSIRTTQGELVFDSGDQFEQITRREVPELFNSNGTSDTFDTRSDNKGAEPEALVLGKAFGRTYAFIGLERTGGILVYDISDPFKPSFVHYVNTSPDDISAEGLLFVDEKDSPNGNPLLIVSHEISSTTTIFEITNTQELLVSGSETRSRRPLAADTELQVEAAPGPTERRTF